MTTATITQAANQARFIRKRLPPAGLFAGHEWRISPEPFHLDPEVAQELEFLGRVFLQFYKAVNLLYRQSVAGKEPSWVARYLDLGKRASVIERQRSPSLKGEIPRVIRPDILITDDGLSVSELDSVPGGIGLTAWLNQTYSALRGSDGGISNNGGSRTHPARSIIGGASGMIDGFAGIFGEAPNVHIVISDEAATYRPEMHWLAAQIGGGRFQVRDTSFEGFAPGAAVYRFFELFDVRNVPNAELLFQLAEEKKILLTPPARPIFEEKLLFALLWNRNLSGFWHRELGATFFERLQKLVPYTWVVDPAPIPPHAAIPELNLTDWHQLKALSQRQRELILKVSGYSENAWGARGVFLGNDLSQAGWAEAVDKAITQFEQTPYVLQRYHKPAVVASNYYDFDQEKLVAMPGRVRLCPYYFVVGEGDAARTHLGGVLATICPANKKIIHGMKEAILAPCSTATEAAPAPPSRSKHSTL